MYLKLNQLSFFIFDKVSGCILNKMDECESNQVRDNVSKNVSEIIHIILTY